MAIVAKGDDVRSGKKAKAHHGRLHVWTARESMGEYTDFLTVRSFLFYFFQAPIH